MRSFFLLLWLAGLGSGQNLQVKSANARTVELEWTGTTGPVVIERTLGAATQQLATVDQGKYQDAAIDRFATYRYRVSAGGKRSNEVTVGPPPAGVLNVAPLPKGADATKYGTATAIALDENGDPVIAFEWVDPNGDNDNSDSEIRFVRWSRATYRWLPPVRVQVVGDIATQNLNPISIACDRKTGVLAIASPVLEKGATIAVSTDGGLTWSSKPVPGSTGTVPVISIALADGQAHVVVTSAEPAARYLTGPIDNISSWKSQPLPAAAGWKQPENTNVGLKLDPSGKPLIAFYEAQPEGDGRRFTIWRPGETVRVVLETKRSTDTPDLALTTGGGKIGLLIETPLDEKDEDHGVWYLQSTDGATWSKPSKLPVDGPRSTNPPLDVAIDSRGRIVAAFGSNSGSDTTVCNFPAVSRSNDGAIWKTCGPGKAEGAQFGAQPVTLRIIEAENDKAYVLWQEQGENKFQEGVLVWHEK